MILSAGGQTEQGGRGPNPDDSRLFSPQAMERLHAAGEEIMWLLGRGYPAVSVVSFVGNRHQLERRQRLALTRALCSEVQRVSRARRLMPRELVRGEPIQVDGFNLLITLEVALSGGLLVRGFDGAMRDLAGLRGSYDLVAPTETAIGFAGALFTELGASSVQWLLDAPVSNSGRLRDTIVMHAHGRPWTVRLVPSADRVLVGADRVASSDARVLDRCASWVNGAAWIVADRLPGARIVDFGPLRGAQ